MKRGIAVRKKIRVKSHSINAYIGSGSKVHLIPGRILEGHGYALCGLGGKISETDNEVDCKACLREAERDF